MVRTNSREIFLVNQKFSALAGVLSIGYFLHPIMVPIIRKNENQNNNERDVKIGFALVLCTYMMIGAFGYFGFMGYYFRNNMARNLIGEDKEPLT